MAHIEFLDETMRDGQQSLWGMRMQAGMALPVAPLIDRSGFRVIDLTGSSLFEVMIRTCRENPWEGLDLLVRRHAAHANSRRHAVERFCHLRRNAGFSDGRVDAATEPPRLPQHLDL